MLSGQKGRTLMSMFLLNFKDKIARMTRMRSAQSLQIWKCWFLSALSAMHSKSSLLPRLLRELDDVFLLIAQWNLALSIRVHPLVQRSITHFKTFLGCGQGRPPNNTSRLSPSGFQSRSRRHLRGHRCPQLWFEIRHGSPLHVLPSWLPSNCNFSQNCHCTTASLF